MCLHFRLESRHLEGKRRRERKRERKRKREREKERERKKEKERGREEKGLQQLARSVFRILIQEVDLCSSFSYIFSLSPLIFLPSFFSPFAFSPSFTFSFFLSFFSLSVPFLFSWPAQFARGTKSAIRTRERKKER